MLLLFKSFDDEALRNPFDGPDVHGEEGHVAGDKYFVPVRELESSSMRFARNDIGANYLEAESVVSGSNNDRLVRDLSSRGLLVYRWGEGEGRSTKINHWHYVGGGEERGHPSRSHAVRRPGMSVRIDRFA